MLSSHEVLPVGNPMRLKNSGTLFHGIGELTNGCQPAHTQGIDLRVALSLCKLIVMSGCRPEPFENKAGGQQRHQCSGGTDELERDGKPDANRSHQ